MKTWLAGIILTIFTSACSATLVATPLPASAQPTPAGTQLVVEVTMTSNPSPIVLPTGTLALAGTLSPENTPTPAPTTLLLWENLPPAQTEKLQGDISAFSASFPNYLIQIQPYDDPETLAAAIVEGRVDYDIVLGPSSLLAPLQGAGKLQAMNELFPASFLNGFAGASLTGATQGGRLWGLPDTAGFHLLLFYNLDLVERPPATDAELVELAEALTGKTNWSLVLNSQDPLWVVPWVWAYGGWLTDGDGTPTLDSEAMVKALAFHLSWHDAPAQIAPLTNHTEARQLFSSGQAAMMIDGEWAIDELTQGASIPWGVTLLPTIMAAEQRPGPLVLGRYWAVGQETSGPRAEAAIAFLEFITRPERQLAWTESFGLLPTQRNALAHPKILSDPALRISAQQLQAGRGAPLNTNLNAIFDAMRPPLEQMLAGTLTPAEAATQMQKNAP